MGIRVEPHELSYHGEVVHRSRHAEDHAHVFELRCASAPEVSVDRREVISAEFLAPDDALSRGVIGVVRMYFEAASRAQRAQASRSEPKASEDQQVAERRPVG